MLSWGMHRRFSSGERIGERLSLGFGETFSMHVLSLNRQGLSVCILSSVLFPLCMLNEL